MLDFVLVEDVIDDLKINLNGHFQSGDIGVQNVSDLSDHILRNVNVRLNAIQILHPIVFFGYCSECGHSLQAEYNKETNILTILGERCIYPEGISEYHVDLHIPSGKIAIGNDFRNYFTHARYISVEHQVGMKQYVEYFAKQGLGTCFVGNSCPNVAKVSKDTFLVSSNISRSVVANVITDWWWISLCDHDLLIANGGKIYGDVSVVHVEPGYYRMIIFPDSTFDTEHDEIYAMIKKLNK